MQVELSLCSRDGAGELLFPDSVASENHVNSHRPGILTLSQTQRNSVTQVWDSISHLFVTHYQDSEAWGKQVKERQWGYRLWSIILVPFVINLLPQRKCLIRSTLRGHASVFLRELFIFARKIKSETSEWNLIQRKNAGFCWKQFWHVKSTEVFTGTRCYIQ